MESVGIRELRQNASKILERVKSGETVTVTDRGRAIARITPEPATAWDALIESGLVRYPSSAVPLHEIRPKKSTVKASAILSEIRADER